MDDRELVLQAARRGRDAAAALRMLTRDEKDAALLAIADALTAQTAALVTANRVDVDRAVAAGTSPAIVDRLTLTAERMAAIAGYKMCLWMPRFLYHNEIHGH